MRRIVLVVPAVVLAGCVGTPPEPWTNARDPQVKVPAAQYGSAFEGYRGFKDEELLDWRGANDGVGAAGGHAGHR
jgi:hypothetical protein